MRIVNLSNRKNLNTNLTKYPYCLVLEKMGQNWFSPWTVPCCNGKSFKKYDQKIHDSGYNYKTFKYESIADAWPDFFYKIDNSKRALRLYFRTEKEITWFMMKYDTKDTGLET